ncbi:hypothetical protein ACFL5Z_19375, partial [Planctomycetota bacterium]
MKYPLFQKKENQVSAIFRMGPALVCAIFVAGLIMPAFAKSADQPAGTHLGMPRPRLFFTAKKMERLRERIGKEAMFKEAWTGLL